MVNYEYSDSERSVLGLSIIALIETILIAFRINGNYSTHWSVVFIPLYFLFFLCFLMNIYLTRNYFKNVGWSISQLHLLISWINLIGLLTFIILLSFELSKPESIGKITVFWPLIIVLCINILLFFAWPNVLRKLFSQTDYGRFSRSDLKFVEIPQREVGQEQEEECNPPIYK